MSFHPPMEYAPAKFHRSERKLAEPGEPFTYTAANQAKFDEVVTRYPPDRRKSAILYALYLAQNTGQPYQTLFSDESDGPLDPERKVQFMRMKREVLRQGGYQREFFISQTPELVAEADAVIDVQALTA